MEPTPKAGRPAQGQMEFGKKIWGTIRIINVRLRFIFLMILVGLIAGNWETIQNYFDRWRRPAHAETVANEKEIEYYCPMHPNIVRSEPGNCPICGMPLAKRAKTAHSQLPEGVLAQVQMSPQKVEMGRIATSPVERNLLSREIRTIGIIDYDETRRAFVAARIKGRLDKLFVNFIGQQVIKGDPLAQIYSPDLLVAQEELLTAVRQTKQRPSDDFTAGVGESLVDATKRKLLLWGITPQQIDQIVAQGKADTHMTIVSPIAGIVTDKKVLEGQYVAEGDDLYTIADLSNVWMQAKIFEDQISGVSVGTAVEITSVAFPDDIFAGQITFVAYTVDAATRTLSARVEVANPDLKLKPGMYVTATIRLPVGRVTEVKSNATSEPVGPATNALGGAFLALADSFANDKSDSKIVSNVEAEARALAAKSNGNLKELASNVAQIAHEMSGKDFEQQRVSLKTLSAKIIELLRLNPPQQLTLFVVHCPMVKADWIQSTEDVANPYYGSKMLRCGEVIDKIASGATSANDEFAQGYYCPIYPDKLFDQPLQCPVDKFPMKLARVEKVLAVPASAVINTGNRTIVYRESAPGVFDMIEVRLGGRAGEYFPVISGLKARDRVATAGAFIVDAENRLNPAAGAQYFGATGSSPDATKPEHQHGR